MIPVRVRADLKPILANERRFSIEPGHPLAGERCPACDQPLSGSPSVMVLVGYHPDDRKPSGWTSGAAVMVHEACAVAP